jgi:hypothetical protein
MINEENNEIPPIANDTAARFAERESLSIVTMIETIVIRQTIHVIANTPTQTSRIFIMVIVFHPSIDEWTFFSIVVYGATLPIF